jgi:hypothetical protein
MHLPDSRLPLPLLSYQPTAEHPASAEQGGQPSKGRDTSESLSGQRPSGTNVPAFEATHESAVKALRETTSNTFDSDPPECFHNLALFGKKQQIAWALKLAGILTRGTVTELNTKLRNEVLWMNPAGRTDFYVYVSKKLRREQVEQASEELKWIKQQPYHPAWARLPRGYIQHKKHPLKAPSETLIAEVLHKVGILEEATISSLHLKIGQRGHLFGKRSDELYIVYLHNDYEQEVVKEAKKLLQSEPSSSTTAMDVDNEP